MKTFDGFYKGVNFGGWLSQCDYSKDRLDNFITEADFERVSHWGIDHVRVPVDYNVIQTEDGEYIESGFKYVENAILWCKKYGLNMVLDLHKTCGFVFDDPNYVGFFDNEKLQLRFCKLWREIAERFGKYSDMLAFELLNEVTDPKFNAVWNKIAKDAIAEIRKVSPDIKILLGGYHNCAIEAIFDLDLPTDKNVVFNFHCYEPIIFTHQGAYWVNGMKSDFRISYPESADVYANEAEKIALYKTPALENFGDKELDYTFFVNSFKPVAEYCEKHDIALYCGEYGFIDLAEKQSGLRWLKDINKAFEELKIGRAIWSYKEMDFGLIDKGNKDILDEIVKFL
ncbi:MAG: cellulase family glycosylhydrolase [Oscillospiraceae bacterium]|nr:cellulase family glycosylhydrolase [Oscillospiraceae bacterium]